jgi:hypothetical protein
MHWPFKIHGERLEKSAAHRELLSSRPVSSIPNRQLLGVVCYFCLDAVSLVFEELHVEGAGGPRSTGTHTDMRLHHLAARDKQSGKVVFFKAVLRIWTDPGYFFHIHFETGFESVKKCRGRMADCDI